MKKISSAWTFFFKRVFPVAWFGFLALFLVTTLATEAAMDEPMLLAVPALMAIVGFAVMKTTIWNLADEVYDCGDFLRVRKGAEEEAVPLSNIMNISASLTTNPPRVILRLAKPSRFGDEIAFLPEVGLRLNPFARLPVVDDLIVRADRARSRRVV